MGAQIAGKVTEFAPSELCTPHISFWQFSIAKNMKKTMWFLDTYVYEVTVQNYTEGSVRRNPENKGPI